MRIIKNTLQGCVIEKCIHITSLFTVFEAVYGEDFYFGGETHDFWEIVCVVDGVLGVTAGKDVFPLERGQAVLHKPMEFHRVWAEKGTKPHIVILTFTGDLIPKMKERRFTLQEEELQELCSLVQESGQIFEFETSIWIKNVRQGQEMQAHLFVSRFENLLLTLVSRKETAIVPYASVSAQNYRRIVKVLEEHLTQRLTLSEVAVLSHMSEASVKKTFSRYAGIGLMAYFNQLKIRRAITCLEEGKSVGETAEMLGFGDQNYFSTVFKRVTGKPPTGYMSVREKKR